MVDMMNLILLFLTFSVRGGLSRDYEANLGGNSLLQVYLIFFFVYENIGEHTLVILKPLHL